jgi:branched-subunit amino acid aminotransferase/4-amino-4-deoxychorismate lyase
MPDTNSLERRAFKRGYAWGKLTSQMQVVLDFVQSRYGLVSELLRNEICSLSSVQITNLQKWMVKYQAKPDFMARFTALVNFAASMSVYPVSFNNRILPGSESIISGYHAGLLHGYGVFTTIKIDAGKPLFAAAHYQRLQQQAVKIGLNNNWSSANLAASLAELLAEARLTTGKARITLMRKTSPLWPSTPWAALDAAPSSAENLSAKNPRVVSLLAEEPLTSEFSEKELLPFVNIKTFGLSPRFNNQDYCNCLITIAPVVQRSPQLRLTLSPYRCYSQSPTAGLKTLNYVDNLMISNEARARGYDAAVILNEHENIVGSALANIFWIAAETLYTPALATGCVNGITRQIVLYLARQLAIPYQEVSVPITSLNNVAGILLTSAVQGLQPVVWWQQQPLFTNQLPLVQKLQHAYQALLAANPDNWPLKETLVIPTLPETQSN